MAAELIHGDCIEQMAALKAAGRTVQSVITDPPYGYNFMGAKWDAPDNIAFRPETWRLACDLLPPGGYLAAFGGARTEHRLTVAIEDAGFEVRDKLLWLYGSGFPKSRSLLKPAYEPIVLARKPGPLRHLAIDACRVPAPHGLTSGGRRTSSPLHMDRDAGINRQIDRSEEHPAGRWPSNILHDGSAEVLDAFAAFGTRGGGDRRGQCSGKRPGGFGNVGHDRGDGEPNAAVYADQGSAARFFPALGYSDDDRRFWYSAKASKAERGGSRHPTIKPMSVCRWLCRLITPPGGTILDPFAGSGTTLRAALDEGFHAVGIEREAEYITDARMRLGLELEAAD